MSRIAPPGSGTRPGRPSIRNSRTSRHGSLRAALAKTGRKPIRRLGRSVRLDDREDQLEPRAAFGRHVAEVTAVRDRIRLRDRESESGALAGYAPLEAFEQPRPEGLRHALPRVFDGDPKMTVPVIAGDAHRWTAVAPRVREQVRHDALYDERIDYDDEVRIDVQRYVAAAFILDEVLQHAPERKSARAAPSPTARRGATDR